ncbi:MAG: TonB-dependent receptor [Pseudomonadota bacterium]
MTPATKTRAIRRNAMFAGALAAAAIGPLATCAFAQDDLDEIVVTATRRPATTGNVAPALTVINGGVAASDKLVTDALVTAPGVYLQQTTPGQGAAIIRGLRGSALLHLVDGIRLNNALFRSAPTQYLALVPVTAVDRIEVLRGTPASLYGTDAVGGAIQVVTRSPEFSEIGTRINGDVGLSFDSAELMRSIRSTVNIGAPTLAAIASANYLTAGNRRVGGGDRIGPSNYSALGARLALAGQPSDVWRWAIDLQYAEQPETPRVDELVPGFGQTEPASAEFRFEPDRRTFLHGRLERDAGWLDLDWRVDAAWQRIDDDRATRDFGSVLRRRERNASDLFGLTLSAGRDTERGSWLVGAEHYDDRVDSSRFETDINDGTAQVLAPRFPDGARVRQSSLYTHVAHDVTARQTLNAGLRWSRARVTLPAAQATAAASLSVTDIGADIGWIVAITDAWQFVANAGRGFRAPNVFDLGTLGERPGNRFNVPNTALESERVQHADAGFRYRRGRDQFEVVAYTLRYDDRITSVLTGDVTPSGRDVVRSENGERADIYGIEAGGRWTLTSRVTGHAVLNYTRGEQREFDNPAEPGDRIPPLSGRLGINYASNAFTAEGWINFSREQDRLSARDVRDPRIDPAGTAGWVSADARITWQDMTGWQIAAGVDNLLDARYRVHGSGIDAVGRNLYLTLRYAY